MDDRNIARIIKYITNFNLLSRFDFFFRLFFEATVKSPPLILYANCILSLKGRLDK